MTARRIFPPSLLVVLLLAPAPGIRAEEGMYPVSSLAKLDLAKRGLRITARDLYNPSGVSLVDAIVQVGGCTGAFVSPSGLVLTNHHCAFGAVQAVSTEANDYVTNGFMAAQRADELPARGMTARVTESYRDVSAEVLEGLAAGTDPAARTKAIERRTREIVARAEQDHPGKRAEVAEMFAGRTYVLFVYASYHDVRLVYVPPRAIGEFGGEDDNWKWPRHTGDFSFLRVYVAPDGSPAEFAKENVPLQPRRHLVVNAAGVRDGDPVFMLGYPGRTVRHRTSYHLAYEQAHTLPTVSAFNAWQIRTMEEMAGGDRAIALKFDARIKGLANTKKNYRGKLQGLRRLDLVARKRADEQRLQAYIDADPERASTYGRVLKDIGAVYDEMMRFGLRTLTLGFLAQGSPLLATANHAWAAAAERAKPDVDRLPAYTDRTFPQMREQALRGLRNVHLPFDRVLLRELLRRVAALPPDQRLNEIDEVIARHGWVDAFLDAAYARTTLLDAEATRPLFAATTDQLAARGEPLLDLAAAIYAAQARIKPDTDRRDGELSRLLALYVEIREQFEGASFVPDANRTLRLTMGGVKGYAPADATRYSPITTLSGVLEKTTGEPPYYDTPARVVELAKARDFGAFVHPQLKDIPVALLYDTDTTGGNSGSPVMNAQGELIGVNFDRAWEATINDYAWSPDFSRSIGVDIRYVLWVTDRIGRASHLLEEMGVRVR